MPDALESLPFREPTGYQGPKRSLVLAGGGMRLAYQAGAMQALHEQNLVFHHADGTSGGIFNLAMLLSGLSLPEMGQRWRTLQIKKFISYFPFRQYLNPFRLPAFGDADGIRRKVFPHLGIDINKINQEQQISGTFNVCNYSDKTNEAIQHPQVTLPHLIAGVSLPIFMPAVKIGPDWYIDAVWIKDANLTECIRRGAEEIWLLWAIGNERTYKKGSFNQYVHMIEMSANGALFAEFEYLNELNLRIGKGESPYGQKAPIKVHVIKPAYPLPLDTDLYFNKINTTTLLELGYADAKEYLLHLSGPPAAPSVKSTQMKSAGIGCSVRAKLKGTLLNQPATLHLSLYLPDVYAYLQAQNPYQLGASLSLSKPANICYGYNGKVAASPVPASNNRRITFSFQVIIADHLYYLTGELSGNPRQLRKLQQTVKVSLFLGEASAVSNQPVCTSDFIFHSADHAYLYQSISFYNYQSWFEKRRAKKALLAYIFSRN